jgi:hypothetical protein
MPDRKDFSDGIRRGPLSYSVSILVVRFDDIGTLAAKFVWLSRTPDYSNEICGKLLQRPLQIDLGAVSIYVSLVIFDRQADTRLLVVPVCH